LFWNQGVESVTSFLILVGCRARIRTWAKGFKVLCATTTQPGTHTRLNF
jgi:hypothetical protein